MTSARTTAEAYVREKCPELMELSKGCLIEFTMPERYHEFSEPEEKVIGEVLYFHIHQNLEDCDVHALAYLNDWSETYDFAALDDTEYKIIGHPIQLHHWLQLLAWGVKYQGWKEPLIHFSGAEALRIGAGTPDSVIFSLLTGQPATEQDYQAFCDIVGISSK